VCKELAMITNADCIERMKDTEAVRATMRDIKECMAAQLPDVKWWIHAGTALAAYYGRNEPEGGVVLPGDNDIDFAVAAETCPVSDFIKAFDDAGFTRGSFFRKDDVGTVLRYFKRGVPFDCYWSYLKGRKRFWVTSGPTVHVLPAYLFEDLRLMKFLGIELPAPYPLEAYCSNMWKKVGDRFPAPPEGESLTVDWEWRIKP